MATYESLITINGKVGDMVFYNLNGKNVVRKKSGFNKNAFKKSPSYEKVRQNSSEFGHCSKVGKIIRQSLYPYINESGDALLYQKFAKLMTEIKNFDSAEKGKRTVRNGLATPQGKSLLTQFQFGEIPNIEGKAVVSSGLFGKNIEINNEDILADQIVLISLKIDFENYSAENYEEEIIQNNMAVQNLFDENDEVLYFAVLKQKDKIIQMGFI